MALKIEYFRQIFTLKRSVYPSTCVMPSYTKPACLKLLAHKMHKKGDVKGDERKKWAGGKNANSL